jgi:hypothetical protein
MGMDLKEMKTIFKTKIMVTYMINVQWNINKKK